jgi:putative oxidoreductase
MDHPAEWVYALIRYLSAGIWLFAGLFKLFHYSGAAAVAKGNGVPFATFTLTPVIIMEMVGCALLFSNHFVWAVALVWILFMIPGTILYHLPWYKNGAIIFPEMVQFSKNLSIAGGLLALMVLDPTSPPWLHAILFGN